MLELSKNYRILILNIFKDLSSIFMVAQLIFVDPVTKVKSLRPKGQPLVLADLETGDFVLILSSNNIGGGRSFVAKKIYK